MTQVCHNIHSFVDSLKASDYYQLNSHLTYTFQICFGSNYFRWHNIRLDLSWSLTYDDFMRLADFICNQTEWGVAFFVE